MTIPSAPGKPALLRQTLLSLLLFGLLGAPVLGAPSKRRGDFDQTIAADLRSQNPEAAALFVQANEARDRGDMKNAKLLYERVRRLAPTFFHATRRLCWVETALGNRARGLELCREALASRKTPENLAALASALVNTPAGVRPTESEMADARTLAREAIELDPKSAVAYRVLAELAILRNDLPGLVDATEHIERLEPEEPSTHTLRVIVATSEGKYSEAERAIDRAVSLGLPSASVKGLRQLVRSAKPWPLRVLPIAALVLAGWLGGFLVLFLVGFFLSRIALRAAREMPAEATGRAHGMNLKVLRLYGTVLRLCCVFYYASIPLLLLTVVGVGGGLIYAFFAMGRIPVKLIVIIAIVAVTSLITIVRSLFARARDADPGLRLDLTPNPKLRGVLDEVATRVGTRPVDQVYVVPGTTVAVMERGSMLKQMGGHPERCLILGVAALEGLRLRAFKAILAHEYGHFSNRDTEPGGLSLSVTHSLQEMAFGLARGGAATWYNPAWLFVNGFQRVFLRISHGASRLQEALADRWAAFNYGSAAFEEGLTQIVVRGVRFSAQIDATVRQALSSRVAVSNFYDQTPAPSAAETEIEEEIQKSLARTPSPYDSHPSPVQRFEWVRALAAPGVKVSLDDDDNAWTLISDRPELERKISQLIHVNLVSFHGVDMPSQQAEGAV